MAAPKTEYAAHCASIVKRRNVQRLLEAVAIKHGAVVTEVEDIRTRSETALIVEFHDWRMNCDLDAHCPSGVFMGNWHTRHNSTAKYDQNFATAIAGDVNTCHFHKATLIAERLQNFLDLVDRIGLAYLADHRARLNPPIAAEPVFA